MQCTLVVSVSRAPQMPELTVMLLPLAHLHAVRLTVLQPR